MIGPAQELVVGLVTVPDAEVGRRIANDLVELRLAACVHRLPGVESVYRWEGRIEQAREELLVIKTQRTRIVPLTQRVRELHPYQTPEILFLPLSCGSSDYLDWVVKETSA